MPENPSPDFLTRLLNDLLAMSPWEGLAVAAAVAYLVFAIRQNRWCWPAAILSSAIFFVLMLQASLPMQALLQLFYIGMAVYGWWHWSKGGEGGGEAPVVRWPLARHVLLLAIIATTGLLFGWAWGQQGEAAWPILDSLVACGAVAATWMVARKVLENWLYWLVIDAISAFLYFHQGLALTGLLFLCYLVFATLGYFSWRKSWLESHA